MYVLHQPGDFEFVEPVGPAKLWTLRKPTQFMCDVQAVLEEKVADGFGIAFRLVTQRKCLKMTPTGLRQVQCIQISLSELMEIVWTEDMDTNYTSFSPMIQGWD